MRIRRPGAQGQQVRHERRQCLERVLAGSGRTRQRDDRGLAACTDDAPGHRRAWSGLATILEKRVLDPIISALKKRDDRLRGDIVRCRSGAAGEDGQRSILEVAVPQDCLLDLQAVIRDDTAVGYLQAENGIHRLVRLSPFNANNKRQTSFCAVSIIPEVDDEIKVDIKDDDIRIDTFRASGAGGQHVNKTSSAIRITHFPTGIVVTCQNERSQHQNKDLAMRVLRARIVKYEEEKRDREDAAKMPERKSIEWGNQIRSYVFQPYTLVKDHRTDIERGNIQAVMDGEISDFIIGYLKMTKMKTAK